MCSQIKLQRQVIFLASSILNVVNLRNAIKYMSPRPLPAISPFQSVKNIHYLKKLFNNV